MAIPAVEVYQVLEKPLGAEGARVLVEFVETSVQERAVTKEDLWNVEKRLSDRIVQGDRELSERIVRMNQELSDRIVQGDQELSDRIVQLEKSHFDRLTQVERVLSERITGLEWRMKVYLILISALIIVTNPKVLGLIGKLLTLGK